MTDLDRKPSDHDPAWSATIHVLAAIGVLALSWAAMSLAWWGSNVLWEWEDRGRRLRQIEQRLDRIEERLHGNAKL